MSTELEIYQNLKRQVMLFLNSTIAVSAILVTIFHRLEPDPLTISLIVPPIFAIISLSFLGYLYYHPEQLDDTIKISFFLLNFGVGSANIYFIQLACKSSELGLVDLLPGPITSGLLILPILSLILQNPSQLTRSIIIFWAFTSLPILLYLLAHPIELQTSRGMELFMSLGPAMMAQNMAILFHSRVIKIVEQLYQEKIEYCNQIIEQQTIRQQTVEEVFSQIHNGPLQTLALLLHDLQLNPPSIQKLSKQLESLNLEIRTVGHNLINMAIPPKTQKANAISWTKSLRLGGGQTVDLTLPLHSLLHEVYCFTLARNLPYFSTIKVKIRNFDPYPDATLSLDLKKSLCLWLEEVICNVGKHAEGATRIIVVGEYQAGVYYLKIQDNGKGINSSITNLGTTQAQKLARKLMGRFSRKSTPQGGVICQLTWSVSTNLLKG